MAVTGDDMTRYAALLRAQVTEHNQQHATATAASPHRPADSATLVPGAASAPPASPAKPPSTGSGSSGSGMTRAQFEAWVAQHVASPDDRRQLRKILDELVEFNASLDVKPRVGVFDRLSHSPTPARKSPPPPGARGTSPGRRSAEAAHGLTRRQRVYRDGMALLATATAPEAVTNAFSHFVFSA